MKKVVVTGATSMVGAAVVRECVKNGIKVLALVRKASERIGRLPKSDLLEIRECRLEDMNSILGSGEKYDVLYHFAWTFTPKVYRNDPILQAENIKYTLDAVKLAQRLGCKKFVGAGSQAEYGSVKGTIYPITEIHPQTSYGISKYAAGQLSRKLCDEYGIVHIWARIFSVYGCYDNPESMLMYAINQFLEKQPARFTAATQNWDFLYEDDAGKAFYLLGEKADRSKIYCVASGQSRKLKEFILELKQNFSEAQCIFSHDINSQPPIGLQPDISDLKRDTGFEPEVKFEEGIKIVVRYAEGLKNISNFVHRDSDIHQRQEND